MHSDSSPAPSIEVHVRANSVEQQHHGVCEADPLAENNSADTYVDFAQNNKVDIFLSDSILYCRNLLRRRGSYVSANALYGALTATMRIETLSWDALLQLSNANTLDLIQLLHTSLFITNIAKKDVLRERDNLTRRFAIIYDRQDKFESLVKDYSRLLGRYSRLESNNVANQEKFGHLRSIVEGCVRRKISKKKAAGNAASRKLKCKICYLRQVDASFLCGYILCMLCSELVEQCPLGCDRES